MKIPIQSVAELGRALRAVRRSSGIRIDDMAATALSEPAVRAAAVTETAVAAPVASRFEPIQDDEVAAFKQALAAASAGGGTAQVAKGVSTRSGPHSYTLLTGFEDTEMPDAPVSAPALSATQYGDLM